MPAPAARPPAWSRRVRAARGQATLDYVTVLAVVGAVLVLGTGVAIARGGEIGGAVRGQFVRALCVVRAGDCDRDRAPCVVHASSEGRSASANIVLVRVGRDHLALVDERSDGTFALTLVRSTDLGVEVGLGVGARFPLGGRLAAAGIELRAAIIAHEGRGRVWLARSREEVEGLLLGLSGTLVPKVVQDRFVREPDETITQHGWSVTLGGTAAAVKGLSVTLGGKDLDGARTVRRTGRTILYLSRSNVLSAALSGEVAVGDRATVGGSASDLAGGSDHSWAIEVDRDGRPLDLVVVHAGAYRVSSDLPPQLSEVAGTLGAAGGSRRYELESHLDLTVPENLAVAAEFISAVRSGRPRPGRERAPVGPALAARLRAHAVLHARVYDVGSTATGVGGHVAVGLSIGAEIGRREASASLLAASTRGPDGTWSQREDCVGAAA